MPPAVPAFSLLFCPPSPKGKDRPPTPFPTGRGDYKLILPGAPPPAPRHQTAYGTDIPCRCSTPEGGAPSLSPANPACSLLFCPPSPKGKDRPPTPFPAGRGDYKLILPGASPLASPGAERARHWLGEHWRYPARGSRLGRRIALPPLHPAGWGKQSGDPEDPPRGGSAAGCRQIVAC